MNKLSLNLIECISTTQVEWKTIGEIVDYIQPTKYLVKDTLYNYDYSIPVLTPGQTFILGYTNEIDGVYDATKEKPIILFDDFTTSFHWVDFSFKIKSSASKILVPFNKCNINFKFIYFFMKTINFKPQNHTRKWISEYSKIRIPIPPNEIQNKIVNILDRFTELTTELTTEITTELTYRKNQYLYYMDKLLSFDDDVEWKNIGEIINLNKKSKYGIKKAEKEFNSGLYPFFTSGKKIYFFNEWLVDGENIFMNDGGTSDFKFYNGKAYYSDHTISFKINDNKICSLKFLFYLLINKKDYIEKHFFVGSGLKNISIKKFLSFKIPIPPIEIQNKIVNILDKFSSLINDLNDGLPKEIELRNKQYEYYRNLLLDFKKE